MTGVTYGYEIDAAAFWTEVVVGRIVLLERQAEVVWCVLAFSFAPT